MANIKTPELVELTRLRAENETLKAENKRLATMNEHHRTTKSMAMELAKDFRAKWVEAKAEIERLQGELETARETNRKLNRRAVKAEAIVCANPSTGAYFQKLGDLFARTLLATIDAERAARKELAGELSEARQRLDTLICALSLRGLSVDFIGGDVSIGQMGFTGLNADGVGAHTKRDIITDLEDLKNEIKKGNQ